MKKILLITLAIILAACSAGGSELSRNQQKWQDANITHYRFELSIGCFCVFRDQMPLTVEVRDGQIVHMAAVDGTLVLDTDQNYEFYAPHATIDLLFAEIDAVADALEHVRHGQADAGEHLIDNAGDENGDASGHGWLNL